MWAVGSKTFANFTAWLACTKIVGLTRLQNFEFGHIMDIMDILVKNIELSLLDSYSTSLFVYTVPQRKHTLHRINTENSKQIFPEKEFGGHSPNFHIHASVNDLYIPTIELPILLQ
jgi:hypothetical protein